MSHFVESTKANIDKISTTLFSELFEGEELKLYLSGEQSLYLRFNNHRVRQNTEVEQLQLKVSLQTPTKSSTATIALSGNLNSDTIKALNILAHLRQEITQLEEDPFLTPLAPATESYVYHQFLQPLPDNIAEIIAQEAEGMDLAGLWSSGPQLIASYNSKGSKHFFATDSFFLDYSLFFGEKAAKSSFSARNFDRADLRADLKQTFKNLEALKLPTQSLQKGNYRVYLAPASVAEICQLMSWGAFSQEAFQRGSSPLAKLGRKEKSFSSVLNIRENFNLGLHPQFNSLGEVSQSQLPLIQDGLSAQFLTSSRTAKEFKLESNFAESSEGPRSLEIASGLLPESEALKALGTGVYLSNLHYLNWSDRSNARLTGMTRYACLWVENGEIKGPIKDMRFDVSLFDIWGAGLESIGSKQHIIPMVGTYYASEIGGYHLPGMLIRDFAFTL